MTEYDIAPKNLSERIVDKKYISRDGNLRRWDGKELRAVCLNEQCLKRPSIAYKGEKAQYCADHKAVGMITVGKKKCEHEDCERIPSFNYPGEKAKFCSEHISSGMINVCCNICKHEECGKIPSFGYEGEKAEYCVSHKLTGMIDVNNKNKLCEYIGCEKRASFNYRGEKAKFCVSHKIDNMIDVNHEKCKYIGCRLRPSFGYEGEQPQYCSFHKLSDMIDVCHEKCKHENCEKFPSFGYEGEKIEYCLLHKLIGMVSRREKCKHEDCEKCPSFGYEGGKAEYCSLHKTTDMIDVCHGKCDYCSTTASFGIPTHPPNLCAIHAKNKEGVIFKPGKKCLECNNTAIYGIKYQQHCELHKTPDEQNLCLVKCKQCGAIEICNRDQICFEYCINSELFKKHSHTRELRIRALLESKIETKITSIDKILDTTCNRKRPDIYYDLNDRGLVVEIDENQHKSYSSECEIARMKQIYFAIGLPKVMFIRYNSDNFTGKYSKISNTDRDSSCITKNGSILFLVLLLN